MSQLAISPTETIQSVAVDGDDALRPLWLKEAIADWKRRSSVELDSRTSLTTLESPEFRLVTVRVRGARDFTADEFEDATIRVYGAIVDELSAAPARHAVRFWNYLPGIHQICDAGMDRYLNFNVGRYEAFRRWIGVENLNQLPTASGIGHQGTDLVIEALGSEANGIAVDNPRQIPPVRYSRRYGPRPPCFARATLVGGRMPRLLVGGTASVVGETSTHPRNLSAQIDETLKNIRCLLDASGLGRLGRFSELRVFYRRPGDAGAISRAVRLAFPLPTRIELMRADLCRRELLVEIEGVVESGG